MRRNETYGFRSVRSEASEPAWSRVCLCRPVNTFDVEARIGGRFNCTVNFKSKFECGYANKVFFTTKLMRLFFDLFYEVFPKQK